MEDIWIKTDKDATYSANTFHVAIYDIVKSHGLQLIGIIIFIYPEAQDVKSELDAGFYQFKRQLKKMIYII